MKTVWQHLRAVSLAFGLALCVPLVSASDSWAADPPEQTEEAPTIGGRFILYDQQNQIRSDEDFLGKFMLVYFGYTFCPDICPTSLSTITAAMEILGDDAKKVTPIFITVDPERDTIPKMRDYLEHFDPSIVGLTGPMEMINRVAKAYRVRFAKVAPPADDPENYVMDHSAGVFLMAPDGTFLVKMAHGITAEAMASRIRDFF